MVQRIGLRDTIGTVSSNVPLLVVQRIGLLETRGTLSSTVPLAELYRAGYRVPFSVPRIQSQLHARYIVITNSSGDRAMPVTRLALVWRKCHYLIQEPESWTSGIKINIVEMISRN